MAVYTSTERYLRDKLISLSNTTMLASTYDADGDGIIDNSIKLDNQLGSYYLDWDNFINKPTTIAGYGITDAFDGQFDSLYNLPNTLEGYNIVDAFSGRFEDLIDKPTTLLGYGITDASDGYWEHLKNKPDFALVATTGDYNDLLNKPSGGSGGIVNHSELNGLDYSSSGHTGFSPSSHTHIGSYIEDPGTSVDREILIWDGISGNSIITPSNATISSIGTISAGADVIAFQTDSPTGNYWDNLPAATTTTMGGFILDDTQMEMNAGVLSILEGILTPSEHEHSWQDITSGSQPAPISHTLEGHTATVTSGQFLKGTGTNTFGWAAHGLTYSDVGADASGTATGLMSTHTSTYNHTNYNTAYSHSQLTTGNPHSVTATNVGLGNVTNESKATMFTNPTFTGTVTLPNSILNGYLNIQSAGTTKWTIVSNATPFEFYIKNATNDVVSTVDQSGNYYAYGDVVAFGSTSSPPNWWDSIPVTKSVVYTGGYVQLDGDLATPTDGYVYGYTTATGKGWYAASGGSTSPLTTKGDIWVYGAADTRLPVGGTNGYVLTVDSAETTGLKWAAQTGSSQWTTSGSHIYYASGYVHVGSTTVLGYAQLQSVGSHLYSSYYGQLLLADSTNTNKRLALGYDGTNGFAFIQSNEATVGVKSLVLNPNGGNVGIGAASAPDTYAKLDITGSGWEALQLSSRTDNGNLSMPIFFEANNSVAGHPCIRGENGSLVMYYGGTLGTTIGTAGITMNTLGNVGIGTASPITIQHTVVPYAKTDTTLRSVAFFSHNDSSAAFGLRIGVTGGTAIANRVVTLQSTDWSTADGGAIALQAGGGNVGIGTASPSIQFHVAGTGRIRSGPTDPIQYALTEYENTGGMAYFGLDSSGGGLTGTAYATVIYAPSAGTYPIIFATGGNPRMTILGNGNVGINVTNPTRLLEVTQTTTTGYALYVSRNLAAASTDSAIAYLRNSNSGDDQPTLYVDHLGSATAVNIVGNNASQVNLGITNTSGTSGLGIAAMGATAYGFADWVSAGFVEGSVNMVVGANTGVLRLQTDRTTRMTILGSGYVGIGTASPATYTQLTVNLTSGSGGAAITTRYAEGTTELGEAALLAYRNAVWSNLYVSGSGISTSYAIYADGTKPSYFAGKVSIGTTSSNTSLTVYNALWITNNTQTSYIQQNVTEMVVHNGYGPMTLESDGDITFKGYWSSAYQTIMTLQDNTGYVNINTTNGSAKYLNVKGGVHIQNVANGSVASPYFDEGYSYGTNANAYASMRFYNSFNDDARAWISFTTAGTERFVMGPTGAFTATGEITAYYSDIRLKTNIQPITNAVDKVTKLSGFTYTANELAVELTGNTDTSRKVGVSAQDLQEVLPEAVRLAPFDNENGKSKSGENYLTVQYEKIVPLLIEAIKELKQEIEDLKKR